MRPGYWGDQKKKKQEKETPWCGDRCATGGDYGQEVAWDYGWNVSKKQRESAKKNIRLRGEEKGRKWGRGVGSLGKRRRPGVGGGRGEGCA